MVFVPVNSLGDVISIAGLIRDAVKALDETRGSAAEYRNHKEKVEQLSKLMVELETYYKQTGNAAQPTAVHGMTLDLAVNCRKELEAFSTSIQKFEPHFREGGSGHDVRDASKKLQWKFRSSKGVSQMWDGVRDNLITLSVLLPISSEDERKVDIENLGAKFDATSSNVSDWRTEQRLILADLGQTISDTRDQLLSAVTNSFPVQSLTRICSNIQSFMQCVCTTTFATYRIVLDIQGRLPSQLERRLYQEPFILEDAHGRPKPIFMDCIDSWPAFDAWLECQFRGMQGHSRVKNGSYVLHNVESNKDITDDCPWDKAFLPGQRIVMCMIFMELTPSSSCPKCQLPSLDTDNDIKCTGCGLWYRRQIDFRVPTAKCQRACLETRIQEELEKILASEETSSGEMDFNEDSISSFKRVRMWCSEPSAPASRRATRVWWGRSKSSTNDSHSTHKNKERITTRHRPSPEQVKDSKKVYPDTESILQEFRMTQIRDPRRAFEELDKFLTDNEWWFRSRDVHTRSESKEYPNLSRLRDDLHRLGFVATEKQRFVRG